ncbi:peptidase T [Spirochaeta thermophila DSM 6578]|uniref:Peptidase T n=1 Tax=Winmispira thermophila (strain ATCC 700085 / DSM 6578 / Z-1203) TaxID=869211 RepID=G0GDC9_WINT7|nr:peptidase T [Spirochaeta thermophila]AEJ60555.1 peptidase T [Spirochaeta thermophila DSM 6578]
MNGTGFHKDIEIDSQRLLERFLTYVRVGTSSDRKSASSPSTPSQWDLLRLLERECEGLGLEVSLSDRGCLYAELPPTPGCEDSTPLCFLTHVDTSEDAPGEGVTPVVHRGYRGGDLRLPHGRITLEEAPELARYAGAPIVTSDGTTLLGADDKAGIAEVMSAVETLVRHPEVAHGPVMLVFTSDEEVGRGTEGLDFDRIAGRVCYTVDGGEEGSLETECFHAWKVVAECTGRPVHPGTARGKLVNAVSMASLLVSLLPRNESPEATDGEYGFYYPLGIEGEVHRARVEILLRDFKSGEMERRKETLRALARAVEASFPGGGVSLSFEEQYRNMGEVEGGDPRIVDHARRAVEEVCGEVKVRRIRGGTDGARIAERLGQPVPNLFTGAMLMHSTHEWVALPVMERAAAVVLRLISLWTDSENSGTL